MRNRIQQIIFLTAALIILKGCTGSDYIFDDVVCIRESSVAVMESQTDFAYQPELGFPRIEKVLDSYEQTIKHHATHYGFDWRFILAVMNQESRFRLHAVSSRGAYGLMQIMPATGRDIASKLIIEDVRVPEQNIEAGVFYLSWVYRRFDPGDAAEHTIDLYENRLRLALAAYNGGPTRVRDAQRLARYLNLDPYRWENIEALFPMLSRRYSTLHHYVWESGRPSGGYFYGWPETIDYVHSVMEYYSYYTEIFE
jgi:membrane-bound lytic murein transglycosylase F